MLDDTTVASVPHMKPENAKKIIRQLEDATEDVLDKFATQTDYSGIDKLGKKM